MSIRQKMTVRDLWNLGEGDVRRELVNGEVIETAPVGGIHGLIVARLVRPLDEFVERHGSGTVLVGDVGFILALPQDPERVRAPDIAFVSRERIAGGGLPEGFLRGTPDLAVEVLSPSDNPIDVQQNVHDYLDAGGRLVWIVASQARTVTVYRSDGSAQLLREGDSLDGETVLPGLLIPLEALFRNL